MLQIALFKTTPTGAVQLLGRIDSPDLVDLVRERLLESRRLELLELDQSERAAA